MLDSSGLRVDRALATNGAFLPTRLKLGTALTATATKNGSADVWITVGVDSSLFASANVTITATTPIRVNGGNSAQIDDNFVVSILDASGSNAGSMSAAHYTLVNGATATPTADRIAKFDGSAGLTGDYLVANTYAQIAEYIELPDNGSIVAPGAGKARIYTSAITGDPAAITDEGVALQLAGRMPAVNTKSNIDVSAGSSTTEGGPIHRGRAGGILLGIYWINMGTAITTGETDYVEFQVKHYDNSGSLLATYSLETNAAGSGSMAANGEYRFTTPASPVAFSNGDYLTRAIVKHGAGQVVGKGAFVVEVNQ